VLQLKKLYPEMASVKRLAADGSIVDRGRDITLRMLLTHTSGFAYPMSDNRIKTWPIADQVVIFEPGTGWVYGASVSTVLSNSSIENRDQQNLDATGILIERVTGMKLHEYFQEHILKPLGVENLGFWPNQAMMDNLASYICASRTARLSRFRTQRRQSTAHWVPMASVMAAAGALDRCESTRVSLLNFRSTLRAISTSTIDAD
jgi:CubicO group peptidase (beta-lactamase class C family)